MKDKYELRCKREWNYLPRFDSCCTSPPSSPLPSPKKKATALMVSYCESHFIPFLLVVCSTTLILFCAFQTMQLPLLKSELFTVLWDHITRDQHTRYFAPKKFLISSGFLGHLHCCYCCYCYCFCVVSYLCGWIKYPCFMPWIIFYAPFAMWVYFICKKNIITGAKRKKDKKWIDNRNLDPSS